MKKILLVLFMSLMTQTALAFDNPITDSYGVAIDAPASKKYVYNPNVADLGEIKTFINKDRNYIEILSSSNCVHEYDNNKFISLITPSTRSQSYSFRDKDYNLIRKRKCMDLLKIRTVH